MIFLTCVVMAWVLWAFGTLVGEKKNCPFSHLGEGDMDEQDFLNRIAQSMRESEQQLFDSLGRQSSRATREQALRQVAMLQAAKEAQITGKKTQRRNA